MRLLTGTCFFLSLLNCSYAEFKNSIIYNADDVLNIQKYTLSIPNTFLPYTLGFTPGLGSSLTLKKSDNGHIQLYAICDRGPNYTIDAPQGKNSTIVFPIPTFSPFIGVIDIIPEISATLTDVIVLNIDDQAITGLPIPSTQFERSIPTDLNFKPLSPDLRGIDSESLDFDSEGNFWFGDEYRPSIFKAHREKGTILQTFTPGNGLPEILKHGIQNRGFEALAIAPNGKVYALIESILIFGGTTKNTANFIRMIELDPHTHQTRTFAYPFDQNIYSSHSSVKIGDLAAIDDTHFLLVEQGATSSGMRNILYIIDISNATDISNITLPLENISSENNEKIQCIKKIKLFDAQQYDWPHEKLEGIAIINENTIAISNDNDFGFSLSINGINSQDVQGYTVDYHKQKLLRYNQETKDNIKIELDNDSNTWIWIINFKNAFSNNDPKTTQLNKECANKNHIDKVHPLGVQGLLLRSKLSNDNHDNDFLPTALQKGHV